MEEINEPTETEKILADKPLMKAIREAREKGSSSSPYKPLIEWWNERRSLERGIDTFLVPYDFVVLKTSEKAVALMDKGHGIFNTVKQLQEEIVKPIKQENELLKEQNKTLIEEKSQLLALLLEVLGIPLDT